MTISTLTIGMERSRLLSIVAAADVSLDTYPWGGGVTSLEALAYAAVLPNSKLFSSQLGF